MQRLATAAGQVAGLMVLLIGLAHFVMPVLGYAPGDMAAVPEAQRDHFVYLGTYAIGTFLVSFGLLTLVAYPAGRTRLEAVFFGLMVLVWGARLALEFAYPVELRLFFLAEPHVALVAAISVIWVGYILAFAARIAANGPAGAG